MEHGVARKDFLQFFADEVTEKDERINDWRVDPNLCFNTSGLLNNMLLITCAKENAQKPDQMDVCIPDIWIDKTTSDKDTALLCNIMQNHSGNMKSVFVQTNSDLFNTLIISVCKSVSVATYLQRSEQTYFHLLRLLSLYSSVMFYVGCKMIAQGEFIVEI